MQELISTGVWTWLVYFVIVIISCYVLFKTWYSFGRQWNKVEFSTIPLWAWRDPVIVTLIVIGFFIFVTHTISLIKSE